MASIPDFTGGGAVSRHELPSDALGMDAASLRRGILAHLEFTLAELPGHVDSEWEPYVALALAVRDRMIQRWIRTQDTYYDQDAKRVADRGMLRVIALADPQQDIAVEQTGIAARHQS